MLPDFSCHAHRAVPQRQLGFLFTGHSHCTKLGGEVSSFLEATATIIQGSGLGPASYTVNAADLRPYHAENAIVKYADDTYLIIPDEYYHTRGDEVSNVKTWAAKNNLQLNCSKSREIVFRSRPIRGKSEHPALAYHVQTLIELTR